MYSSLKIRSASYSDCHSMCDLVFRTNHFSTPFSKSFFFLFFYLCRIHRHLKKNFYASFPLFLSTFVPCQLIYTCSSPSLYCPPSLPFSSSFLSFSISFAGISYTNCEVCSTKCTFIYYLHVPST